MRITCYDCEFDGNEFDFDMSLCGECFCPKCFCEFIVDLEDDDEGDLEYD